MLKNLLVMYDYAKKSQNTPLQETFKILDSNDSALDHMIKSAPEKQVVAWLLKTATSVNNSWIAERLSMGLIIRNQDDWS
jgi:hypothetical protein